MDDGDEQRARAHEAETSRRTAMLWTLALAVSAWGLALLGWP